MGNGVFLGSSEAHKSLRSAFPNVNTQKNLLGGLLKQISGPYLQVSDSEDSGDADLRVLSP